jgi:hypothetical protein
MKALHWIKNRPRWIWPVTAVIVVVVLLSTAVAWSGDGDDETSTGSGSTTTEPSTTTSTSTTTASTTTTTTAPTTTTVRATTTTSPPPTMTTVPAVPVPGAAVVTVSRAGGSGEISVRWNAVPGATGYRVLRQVGSRPFKTVADFDITTGATTAADDISNIWSEGYTYRPVLRPFPGVDHSPWFEVVDYRFGPQRCFKVIAYNPSGDAPASNTGCASVN